MNNLQAWHKTRDGFRFNTNNSVRVVATGEIGTIVCMGTDNDIPVYMLRVPSSEKLLSVKDCEIESAIKNGKI